MPVNTIAKTLLVLSVISAAQLTWPEDKQPPSSDPRNLYAFQDYIYCSADDGLNGRELWRVNLEGTKELVMDITPGSAGSDIYGFGAIGNTLYFGVRTRKSGGDLWRTDGTKAGTWPIKQFYVGIENGYKHVAGEIRGRMVFTIQNYSEPSLWTTDGTEVGTIPFVEDSSDSPFNDFIGTPFFLNNYMYFSAQVKDSGFGVFRSDGTLEGTEMLCRSRNLTELFFSFDQKNIFFHAETLESGIEPWVTDGTTANTRLFFDINRGSGHGGFGYIQSQENVRDPGVAVFVSQTQEAGRELWVSDGTVDGTRSLPEIVPGPGSASPGHLIATESYTFFSARVPEFGVEVWRANPRENEILRLSDINPGTADADPYAFCVLNGTYVLFSANHPEHGEEMWITGPDAPSVDIVRDIIPGPESSFPYYTTELNGVAVFAATDHDHGRELWVTDGVSYARLLADIYSDASINPSSSPRELTAVGDVLYFVANDMVNGSELWRSDGTSGGTQLVKDLFPGRPSSDPRELTEVNGFLYFSANDGHEGERLWRSDGTMAGTVISGEELGSPQHLTPFAGSLICSAVHTGGGKFGRELWRVEHTGNGGRLRDIAEGEASSDPHSLVVAGAFLYFLANDGVHGEELWRTDGSEDGTVMVRDIVDVPYEPVGAADITGVGDRLYFAGETASQGSELWSIDFGKSVAGPVLDIARVDTLLLSRPTANGEH